MSRLTLLAVVTASLLSAGCGGGGGDGDLQVLGERTLQIQDMANGSTSDAFVAYLGSFAGGSLFRDITLQEGDDGRSFVAEQGTPNFAENVANLTDGQEDRFIFELRAGQPVGLICFLGESEQAFFDSVSPPGVTDFQGSDIRQIVFHIDDISFVNIMGDTEVNLEGRIQVLGTPPEE